MAAATCPPGSNILGLDLVPIRPIRGVRTLVGDLTTEAARRSVRDALGGSSARVDCVVHDGAPNVGGAWSSEAYGQAWLVLESLRIATEFLRPGGSFVTKVFRSQQYSALLFPLGQLFDRVESTKPPASRGTSAEIFVVCLGYKGPRRVDPRLLDHKTVFDDVDQETDPSRGPESLLRERSKAQKRSRGGYEDDAAARGTTDRALSAHAFVLSDAPVDDLARSTRLVLDGPGSEPSPGPSRVGSENEEDEGAEDNGGREGKGSDGAPRTARGRWAEAIRVAALAREDPSTDDEIRALAADLLVLGRSELKQLLKWRQYLRKRVDGWRKDAAAAQKAERAAARVDRADGADSDGDGSGSDSSTDSDGSDAEELGTLAEAQAAAARREKRERRKAREAKKRAVVRRAQAKQAEADHHDMELFGLKAAGVRTARDVDRAAGLVQGGASKRLGGAFGGLAEGVDVAEADAGLDSGSDDPETRGARLRELLAGSSSEDDGDILDASDDEDGDGSAPPRPPAEPLDSDDERELERDALAEEWTDRAHVEAKWKAAKGAKGGGKHAHMAGEEGKRAPVKLARMGDVAEADGLGAGGLLEGAAAALADADANALARRAARTSKGLKRRSPEMDARREAREGRGLIVSGAASTPAETDSRHKRVALARQWLRAAPGGGPTRGDDDGLTSGDSDDDDAMAAGLSRPGVDISASEEEEEDIQDAPRDAAPRPANSPPAKRARRDDIAGVAGAAVAGSGAAYGTRDAPRAVPRHGGVASGTDDNASGSDDGAGRGQGRDDAASSSSSEDEFEALPDDAKAEILAMARRAYTGAGRGVRRRSVLDDAYSRWTTTERPGDLPAWFEEDEDRFRRPIPQATLEEIQAEKDELRRIDARPLKKVAEARARKKQRKVKALALATRRASAAADQEDVPMSARLREVGRIYAKARMRDAGGGRRDDKNGGKSKRGPKRDARERADARGQRARDREAKKKGTRQARRAPQKGVRGGRGGGGVQKGGRGGRR